MGHFRKFKTEFAVFLIFFLTYAYFFQGSDHNSAARMDSIRSVLEHGTFIIDRFVYNSADIIKLGGHYFSSKAPGTFFLGFIPFTIAKSFLSLLVSQENILYQWTTYLTVVFSVSVFAGLFCAFIYWFLQQLTFRRNTALAVTVAFGLGTLFFPFSTLFFSHALAAVFLFSSFILLLRARGIDAFPIKMPESQRGNAILVAGLFGSFAVSVEYPAALYFFLIQIYAIFVFYKSDRRLWLKFIVGSALGTLPLFIHNALAFHDLFYLPYEAYAQPSAGGAFAAHAKGFLGIQNAFKNPQFLSVLWKITFDPQRGIFFNCPVLIAAIPGLYFMWKNLNHLRAELVVSLAIVFAAFYVNANFGDSIVYWGGGYSFGPRHLLAAVPFLVIPLACVAEHLHLKHLFWIALFPSVLICWAATAVEPRIPYDYHNPITQFLLPKFLNGVYAINDSGIFSNDRLTENSVAFNWGKLLHLHAQMQMLPLILIWIVFFSWFIQQRKTDQKIT